MNEPIKVGRYKGFEFFFQGISYNCPALRLWGYPTDLQLKRAISRAVTKQEKQAARILSLGGCPWSI